ncbi:MAG: hypothetical protein AAB693_02395 [Patescibacteria group bacterium]
MLKGPTLKKPQRSYLGIHIMLKNILKKSLHHAYLIEGEKEIILPEILLLMENFGIKTSGNPDFYHINLDTFKIEDARNLKSLSSEKAFGDENDKKIFLISVNNFLLEAQNSLLKIFEEPIENTHFFIIVPDTNFLLKTFISRFYFIQYGGPTSILSIKSQLNATESAENFIVMPLKNRIDFLKNLLTKPDPEESSEELTEESVSQSNFIKSLNFLNSLEFVLHKRLAPRSDLGNSKRSDLGTIGTKIDIKVFKHIFKIREYLHQPGSSIKSLLESLALIIP